MGGRRMVKRKNYERNHKEKLIKRIKAIFGKKDQKKQPIGLNKIVLGVVQTLQGQLKDHGVAAYSELTAELPLIKGHRGQLEEVIVNLINNAIEAMDITTGRRRELHLRTALRGRDAITLAIQDSGLGIDPNKLNDIFGAFVTTKARGTGLGLAICRMIVEHHGGQLTASSDGKNGALFQFVLPIAASESVVAGRSSLSG
jgi:signal transduction histidine kinase